MKSDKDLQGLALFVHGALAAFHCLGVVYNFKRHNKTHTGIHCAGLAFDIWACFEHVKELRRLEKDPHVDYERMQQ